MNLIIMSHGKFSEEVLNSAKMIVGEIENSHAITMAPEEGLDVVMGRLESVLTEEETLILVDLYGGTPFNAAVMTTTDRDNVEIITGMNLPMIIEFSTSDKSNLDSLTENLKNIGKMGIQGVAFSFDEVEDDDIEL